jgi:tRNA pseudouridine38-40 synthase
VRGVNAFLPDSVAVRWACEVPADGAAAGRLPRALFGARAHLSLRAVQQPDPLAAAGRPRRLGVPPLDTERMREAARHLLGTHDFSAFRAAGCQAKSPVKHHARGAGIERRGDLVVFTLRASAFLHHMVRNIVGSLIYVGNGRKEPRLDGRGAGRARRDAAAPTFMPDGLYLAKIDYDPKWGCRRRSWRCHGR